MALISKETKAKATAKAKQLRGKAGRAIGWVICWGTVLSGWIALGMSIKNEHDGERLQQQVNHNAHCSIYDRSRIESLEKDRNLLMNKAMDITEGKTEEKEDGAA